MPCPALTRRALSLLRLGHSLPSLIIFLHRRPSSAKLLPPPRPPPSPSALRPPLQPLSDRPQVVISKFLGRDEMRARLLHERDDTRSKHVALEAEARTRRHTPLQTVIPEIGRLLSANRTPDYLSDHRLSTAATTDATCRRLQPPTWLPPLTATCRPLPPPAAACRCLPPRDAACAWGRRCAS